MVSKKMHATGPIEHNQSVAVRRGLLAAFLAIPAGVLAWGLVWEMGFIASIVSLFTAWLALTLYTKVTKAEPTKGAAIGLVSIIVVTVVLSFIFSVVLDAARSYGDYFKITEMAALKSSYFWQELPRVLSDASIWKSYGGDIAMTLVFAALGCFGIVKSLFVKLAPASTQTEAELLEEAKVEVGKAKQHKS